MSKVHARRNCVRDGAYQPIGQHTQIAKTGRIFSCGLLQLGYSFMSPVKSCGELFYVTTVPQPGLSEGPVGGRKENIDIRQFYENVNQIQSLRSKRIKLFMV